MVRQRRRWWFGVLVARVCPRWRCLPAKVFCSRFLPTSSRRAHAAATSRRPRSRGRLSFTAAIPSWRPGERPANGWHSPEGGAGALTLTQETLSTHSPPPCIRSKAHSLYNPSTWLIRPRQKSLGEALVWDPRGAAVAPLSRY